MSGRSRRDPRYEARCREREAKERNSEGCSKVVDKAEPVKSSAHCEVPMVGVARPEEIHGGFSEPGAGQDETFFMSFNVPTMESTRTLDATLTETEDGDSQLLEADKTETTRSRSEAIMKSDSSGSEVQIVASEKMCGACMFSENANRSI